MKINTTFKIAGWDEETVSEFENGGKLTRARVSKSYTGELKGEGAVEYVMFYRPDGTADFVGYEEVNATLDGKAGSFVFEHRGHFKDGKAIDIWTVAGNSGSGELSGISGVVHFSEGHNEEYEITFNYEL